MSSSYLPPSNNKRRVTNDYILTHRLRHSNVWLHTIGLDVRVVCHVSLIDETDSSTSAGKDLIVKSSAGKDLIEKSRPHIK